MHNEKIEPFEGDANRRWLITRGGWPLGPSELNVYLQERRKRLWWYTWKTIGSNFAHTPGEVNWVKRVILDTPMLERIKREEQTRAKKRTDNFLNG